MNHESGNNSSEELKQKDAQGLKEEQRLLKEAMAEFESLPSKSLDELKALKNKWEKIYEERYSNSMKQDPSTDYHSRVMWYEEKVENRPARTRAIRLLDAQMHRLFAEGELINAITSDIKSKEKEEKNKSHESQTDNSAPIKRVMKEYESRYTKITEQEQKILADYKKYMQQISHYFVGLDQYDLPQVIDTSDKKSKEKLRAGISKRTLDEWRELYEKSNDILKNLNDKIQDYNNNFRQRNFSWMEQAHEPYYEFHRMVNILYGLKASYHVIQAEAKKIQAEPKKHIPEKSQTKVDISAHAESGRPTLQAAREGHLKPTSTTRAAHVVASQHRMPKRQ